MSSDQLHERGQAMEEAFFHDVDKQLIERMKSGMQAAENRTELASATGIQDETVLNELIAQGITAETLASVGLIPLVAVAWADGRVEQKEEEAVLRAARETGIGEDHASLDIVRGWLKNKPDDQLLETWKDYVAALRQTLDPAAIEQIRQSVVGRAQRVAESAGGFLGIINTVDPAEREIIGELNEAFEASA